MATSPKVPDTPLFRTLWMRQMGCCALCGQPMAKCRTDFAHATLWKKHRPTFDHIHAKARGGRDHISNLQLAHASCNKRKGKG